MVAPFLERGQAAPAIVGDLLHGEAVPCPGFQQQEAIRSEPVFVFSFGDGEGLLSGKMKTTKQFLLSRFVDDTNIENAG